ncbi:MAG: PaaI family thioesterase [Anaerovibrio sp.]|uniref:PaaI family thioesterase n=1 Tax=Anaerovibrio sp. TaxID=1872532 RepID=UPI0025EBD29A|nr:PaaI family thioesterase [Anaerovibrio sp.]MCR5177096.1 PaaI family thioesterase [Anaerovibrio sp.]
MINRLNKHVRLFYKENPYVELLNISVAELREGCVVLSMPVEEKHCNFYKVAHGGALMSLADTAMGAACLSCNKKVVTLSFDMNFIKSAPVGTMIKATGKVIHNGRHTMVCETEFTNSDGVLFCRASGTFYVLGELLPENS